MNRISAALFFILASFALGFSDEIRLGIFLNGQKIGTSTTSTRGDEIDGKTVQRSDNLTLFESKLLGDALNIRMESTTWSDANEKPIKMVFKIASGGRTQVIEAQFEPNQIKVKVDNNGNKSEKTIPIPASATIVDDSTMLLAKEGSAVGTTRDFYVLDPTLVALVKTTATVKGKSKVEISGKTYDAIQIDVIDPRATTQVYLSTKGDLIKSTGPMGIEMIPENLGEASRTSTPIDLASASAVPVIGKIEKPAVTKSLSLSASGIDLRKLASDQHQTINRNQNTVKIHPVQMSRLKSAKVSALAAMQPKWLEPGLHIPSTDPRMIALSKTILAGESDAIRALKRIRAWVQSQMKPNAGIGVLRDAREVLDTKEGVCRDYAILTATIMRASGIPAKVCSGLLYFNGAFYYHAWTEAWVGRQWVAIDSTLPYDQIGADHIKLGSGSVEDALTFPMLTGAKLRVLGVGY